MAAAPLPHLTLVLGGARSGKSSHAEAMITATPPPWVYIATAEALDAEMQTRIARHRAQRDGRWRTVEAPLDLPQAIAAADGGAVLIDCLTLWLSNILLAQRNPQSECNRLLAALKKAPAPVVAVSNEVGLGIVPDSALGRAFRDAQGTLNQRVAALADRVVLMTAGIPLTLKEATTDGRQR